MNQGKLEVVKQQMARVNISILGISELKWTGVGEFNSDDNHPLLWARIPQKKCSGPQSQQESEMQYLGAVSETTEWFLLFPRQTVQCHSNPSLSPTSNAEEAEIEWFYEDLQDLLELTPRKRCPMITEDWNAKVGSQEIPGVIGKFGLGVQNKG